MRNTHFFLFKTATSTSSTTSFFLGGACKDQKEDLNKISVQIISQHFFTRIHHTLGSKKISCIPKMSDRALFVCLRNKNLDPSLPNSTFKGLSHFLLIFQHHQQQPRATMLLLLSLSQIYIYNRSQAPRTGFNTTTWTDRT